MAQEEVMQADLSNDPIQAAIARIERQVGFTHRENKYKTGFYYILYIA